MHFTLSASRLAIGMCGAVVGSYAAYSAFRNGQALASGLDGLAFGSAFAAVVIGSWFLLPLAAQSPRSRAILMRIGWGLCLLFVLIQAIGFTATHRTTQVGDRANVITGYDTALTGLREAQERLTAMKSNARWQSTAGCTNATVEASIAFCDDYKATQAAANTFSATVSAGKPSTADAQADTIAWVLRADTGVVSRAMPIFMAIVLDIAASLFIWVAMTTYSSPAPVATVATEPPKEATKPAPKKKAKASPKRRTEKAVQKLMAEAIKKPDRRKMKNRNDNQKKLVAAND
jgi:hypothetical protein